MCSGDGAWGPAVRPSRLDLGRAAKRGPSATKVSPAVIEVITAIRNHALAAFPPSRGRIVAADSSAIHTRRLRKGTTRRFQEVIYVTERAGATGNEDISSVHSDVHAQAMLQAQDLVLGFARFLDGSFAGSRAAGLSTDALRGLTSKKTVTPHEDDCEVDELDGPSPKKKNQLQQESLRTRRRRYEIRTLAGARWQPLCVEAVRAALRNKTFAFVWRRRGAHASHKAAKRRRQGARAP